MREKAFIKSRGYLFIIFLMILALSTFIGCSGSGDDALTGTFVDSPVSGLAYNTPTMSGLTDAQGKFYYLNGETVTFSVGGITLGSAKGKSQVTPVDLVAGGTTSDPAVINRCIFLQTLDEDGDLNNGIQINAQTRAVIEAAGIALDFNQTTTAFTAAGGAMANLLAALNSNNAAGFTSGEPQRDLRTAAEAQAHLIASTAEESDRKTVVTTFGPVKGYASDGALIWKGIPYAKPPVGALRWKAPVDPEPWKTVREATASCSECAQAETDKFWRPVLNGGLPRYIGSENCLYLDIYRPQNADENLPVYVWIHGGANIMGSAKIYDGAALAKKGNIIVVVIQYRLGALGWLAHPALRTGDADSDTGNFATLDQIKALEWVNKNIAAFGGDPTNVTIGGQSAGGQNIMNLIVSPKVMQAAVDTFHRAFVQSPALAEVMLLKTVAAGEAETNLMIDTLLAGTGKTHADLTNAEIAALLSSQKASTLLLAYSAANPSSTVTGFMDGNVLPTTGWPASIQAGDYKKVPIVLGTNEYEYKSLMTLYAATLKPFGIPSGSYSWDDLYAVLDGQYTLNDVLPTNDDKSMYEYLGLLKSRRWQMECNDLAEALKAQDPAHAVYSYYFTWKVGNDPNIAAYSFIFGAAHGTEIPFFFGENEDLFKNYSFTAANEAGRVALQNAMMDYLISFVKTGDPNPAGSSLPAWSQWSNAVGENKYIVLDADLAAYQIAMSSAQATHADVSSEIQAFQVATGGLMDALLTSFGILPLP